MQGREFEFLQEVINAFNDNPRECNDWEKSFMSDMSERFEKYADKTYISAKQWAAVDKVATKYEITR